MNRAQRRATGQRAQQTRLIDGARHLTQESGGVMRIFQVAPEDTVDLLAGALAGDARCLSLMRAVASSAAHIETAEAPALCLICPAEIRSMRQVGAFSVVLGEMDRPVHGLGSAICRACATRDDIDSRIHVGLRRIWPDLRPVTIAAGPEAVQ